jgi:hypothetical protein
VAISSFFKNRKFNNFWIETDNQKFIEKYLAAKNVTAEEFDGFPIGDAEIVSPGKVTMRLEPAFFLYQAGYLTVRKAKDIMPASKNEKGSEIGNNDGYYLTYPNHEIRSAMLSQATKRRNRPAVAGA